MDNRILRVGLVGLGSMGNNHRRVISTLKQAYLVGVHDPFYNVDDKTDVEFCKSLQELMALELDYCVVATPTNTHLEIATELIKNQIPILIEKPLSLDYESSKQILSLAKMYGVKGGVGHIERFNPAIVEAKRRIKNGEIGKLHQITTVRQGPRPIRITDTGVIKDLATHDIDLVSFLTGETYRNVSARTLRMNGSEHEDMMLATCELTNNVIVSHKVNWLNPFKERKISILAEGGSFEIDLLKAELTHFRVTSAIVEHKDLQQVLGASQGEVITYAYPKVEPLVTEHESFCHYILGGVSTIATLSDGARTVRIADILESRSNKGMSFEVPDLDLD
jgi:UDP-N-acetylglucosamine 3-dehydrogenase